MLTLASLLLLHLTLNSNLLLESHVDPWCALGGCGITIQRRQKDQKRDTLSGAYRIAVLLPK